MSYRSHQKINPPEPEALYERLAKLRSESNASKSAAEERSSTGSSSSPGREETSATSPDDDDLEEGEIREYICPPPPHNSHESSHGGRLTDDRYPIQDATYNGQYANSVTNRVNPAPTFNPVDAYPPWRSRRDSTTSQSFNSATYRLNPGPTSNPVGDSTPWRPRRDSTTGQSVRSSAWDGGRQRAHEGDAGHSSSWRSEARNSFAGPGSIHRGQRQESIGSTYSVNRARDSGITKYSQNRRSSRFSEASFRSYQRSIDAYSDLASGCTVDAAMRPSDQVHRPGDLELGMVVSAPYHTQARRQQVSAIDENVSYTEFGAVHSKYRKMVLIEDWGEHWVAAPLYSYNGRGLANREHIREEYMHIRETIGGSPRQEADDEPLRAKRDRSWPMTCGFINDMTVIKVTEKINLYATDKCSIEGCLTQSSIDRLIHSYLRVSQNKLLESTRRASRR